MRLRHATRADLMTLRRWDEQPHVIAAGGEDGGWSWAEELRRSVAWREILIAETNGEGETGAPRPVGVLVIIDPAEEESRYWGDVAPGLRAIDIWIGEESDLARGHGAVMMRLALERCFADPSVSAALVDPLASNTRAHRFYERQGFRAVERRRFGSDDCVVYRIEREEFERRMRVG